MRDYTRLHMRVEWDGYARDIWPFVLAAFAVLLAVMFVRRTRGLSYLACFAGFGLYLIYVLDVAFFPIWLSGPYADARRQMPFLTDVNLIPFYPGRFGTFADAVPGFVMNILLTIPFGFGVSFVAPVRAKQIRWLAPVVGLAIEAAQFVISLLIGYVYRQIDVNDVMMNALGVLIGYGIFRFFAWLYVWATQRLGIRHIGLTAYVYDIALQAKGAP